MLIGGYERITPFATAGSGNARWCVARKNGREYFLKQFLAPVQPVQTTFAPTRRVSLRRQACAAFETRKIRLYDALKRVPEAYVVQVEDFFVHDGHYCAASAYLGADYRTMETFKPAQEREMLRLLVSLSECLKALHAAGIVHADLKPEHVVIETENGQPRARLIDFDSGFLESAPPETEGGLEIDPVYMSPEAFRMMSGQNARLNRKADTFAFAVLTHQTLAGDLPGFDRSRYGYPYAAVLGGARLTLADGMDGGIQTLLRKMLKKHPAFRPGDDTVWKTLQKALL